MDYKRVLKLHFDNGFSGRAIAKNTGEGQRTAMPEEQARLLLSYAEQDFNIKLDEIVKNKLLQRIHQIKRGGLGVAIDILFRVLLVTVPDMKDFYQALVSDVDRENALKLVNHSKPIRITEDVLLGAMSMQR